MAVSPDALICVSPKKSMDLPQRPPHAPSRVCGSSASCAKMRKAPGRHPSITTSPHRCSAPLTRRAHKRIALALRPESLPMLFLAEQKICSSNDRVPAASRHLSANADSTAFLLGFRRSYLFTVTLHHHHRLRQRSGRHANVVCGILSLA